MALLGTSDLEVFPLVLGTNTFGWTSDEGASHKVLDAFVAGGGNFIDTADSYSAWVDGHSGGESEAVLGSWLSKPGRRDRLAIGTKVSQHPEFRGLSSTNVAKAADASLMRLGVDHIDVYYAHFDDPQTPLEETAGAFDQLVRSGKVRYVGLSNYSAARVQEWLAIADTEGLAKPVALQPKYNAVARDPYESELAPVAEHSGMGVVPYFALASGFLTGKYRTVEDIRASDRAQFTEGFYSAAGLRVVDVLDDVARAHQSSVAVVALAWLLTRPSVTAPIASARDTEQLAQLMTLASLDLSDEELDEIDRVTSTVA